MNVAFSSLSFHCRKALQSSKSKLLVTTIQQALAFDNELFKSRGVVPDLAIYFKSLRIAATAVQILLVVLVGGVTIVYIRSQSVICSGVAGLQLCKLFAAQQVLSVLWTAAHFRGRLSHKVLLQHVPPSGKVANLPYGMHSHILQNSNVI